MKVAQSDMKKYLIVVVEVKVRDYLSRLLIVEKALARGYHVIFGSDRELMNQRENLPSAIYFDKSISQNKKSHFQFLVDKGHKLVSIDEEGLASQNNRLRYQTQRISRETLELASLVFVWGRSEKEAVLEVYPEFRSKVKITGNPRVDLLKPSRSKAIFQNKVDQIKLKYGDYVFFPSNFTVNHAMGKGGSKTLLKNMGRIKSKEDDAHYQNLLDYSEKMFNYFVELVKATVSEFPELNVMVRPHPSEDPKFWRELSMKYDNLHIQDGGTATPWLKGAAFVIHSSCTTGLEAKFLGGNVIAYLPDTSHEYSKHISNDFSIRCEKKTQVLEILSAFVNKKDWKQNVKEVDPEMIQYHVENTLPDLDASLSIMDHIDLLEAVYTNEAFKAKSPTIKERVKKVVKKFRKGSSKEYYHSRKFPGLRRKELESDLAKFVSDDRMKNIKIKNKAPGLFEISEKS